MPDCQKTIDAVKAVNKKTGTQAITINRIGPAIIFTGVSMLVGSADPFESVPMNLLIAMCCTAVIVSAANLALIYDVLARK